MLKFLFSSNKTKWLAGIVQNKADYIKQKQMFNKVMRVLIYMYVIQDYKTEAFYGLLP